MKDKNKTATERARSLLKTLGSTAIKVGQDALRKQFVDPTSPEWVSSAAERLVEGLDDLKGASMKFGQMLSMWDEKSLPTGWKKALSLLQARATPKGWTEIEPLIKHELGESINLFHHIDPVAYRAASIGQVHRGELLDGKQVAIKIRYPGLDVSLKTDLENLQSFFHKMRFVIKGNFDTIFHELESVFLRELDLLSEANAYKEYAELLKHEGSRYVVPQVIDACSREGILTTEWLTGDDIESWVSNREAETGTKEFQDERNRLGENIFRLVLLEIFHYNSVQSDPNPANFLVLPSGKLGLLDFGAVKKLGPELVSQYKELAAAAFYADTQRLLELSFEMGFLPANASEDSRKTFLQILALASRPFTDNNYNWKTKGLSTQIRELALKYAMESRLHTPPAEVVFLHRRLIGTEQILERIKPELPARDMFCEIAGI